MPRRPEPQRRRRRRFGTFGDEGRCEAHSIGRRKQRAQHKARRPRLDSAETHCFGIEAVTVIVRMRRVEAHPCQELSAVLDIAEEEQSGAIAEIGERSS